MLFGTQDFLIIWLKNLSSGEGGWGIGVAERLSGWDNLGHVPRIDTANSTKELI